MSGPAYSKDTQCGPPKPKRRRGMRRSRGHTVPAEAREALWRRCHGNCEARTQACTGQAEHPHHRKTKGSHGPDHSLSNLLAVCKDCHRWIHDNVAESLSFGWLLPSWAETPGGDR